MFWKGWRDAMCDIFSCDAFDIYGSTEFHCMGWECPQERRMHVASGASIIEIVDGKGRPSDSGELAITCLHNRAMPLLRYRIGDKARWGKECACGRQMPVLESIDGSQEDLLVLPSGRLRSATSIRPTVSLSLIKEFQIVQEQEDLFVFRYVPAKEPMTDAVRQELTKVIWDGCQGEPVKVEFEELEGIDRTKGGKLKMFVSKVRSRLFS
jgi:phenylacetate-CoA ligase